MKKVLLLAFLCIYNCSIFAQIKTESNKEYTNLEEALQHPEQIINLNLSNQKLKFNTIDWSKFTNLEYLTLKNDHLNEIPTGIITLKSLKKIDLSGNDFSVLPSNFWELSNLEEIVLNDDKKMDVPKTLSILAKLPNLKSLHLEGDKLTALPDEILNFKNLENLYLGNNQLQSIPVIKTLDHLKYLDLKGNKIKVDLQDTRNTNFGFKINF